MSGCKTLRAPPDFKSSDVFVVVVVAFTGVGVDAVVVVCVVVVAVATMALSLLLLLSFISSSFRVRSFTLSCNAAAALNSLAAAALDAATFISHVDVTRRAFSSNERSNYARLASNEASKFARSFVTRSVSSSKAFN